MKLITAGKKSHSTFFEKSGIRTRKKFKHHPFFAFVRSREGDVTVKIVTTPEELVKLPKRTKVMGAWPGKTRSDVFTFSVAKLREHIENNPPKAGQVI